MAHLRQTLLGESDVNAGKLEHFMLATFLVLADLLSELLDMGCGSDDGDKLLQILLEGGCVLDSEEDEVLCALGEAQTI